jgi:hypothetical protein
VDGGRRTPQTHFSSEGARSSVTVFRAESAGDVRGTDTFRLTGAKRRLITLLTATLTRIPLLDSLHRQALVRQRVSGSGKGIRLRVAAKCAVKCVRSSDSGSAQRPYLGSPLSPRPPRLSATSDLPPPALMGTGGDGGEEMVTDNSGSWHERDPNPTTGPSARAMLDRTRTAIRIMASQQARSACCTTETPAKYSGGYEPAALRVPLAAIMRIAGIRTELARGNGSSHNRRRRVVTLRIGGWEDMTCNG